MHKEKIERCDCNILHHELVDRVRGRMPGKDEIRAIADLFKVFGDPTRVRIISALFHSEMCVCDIASLLDMTKSFHLTPAFGYLSSPFCQVSPRRKVVFYSLDDEHIKSNIRPGKEPNLE